MKKHLITLLKLAVVIGALAYLIGDWSPIPYQENDILDPIALHRRLCPQAGEKQDLTTQPIRQSFDPSLRERLSTLDSQDPHAKKILAEALNTLLPSPSLYTPEWSREVDLPPFVVEELQQGYSSLAPQRIQLLNRTILDAVFANEVQKRAGPKLTLRDMRLKKGIVGWIAASLGLSLIAYLLSFWRYAILLDAVGIPLGLRESIRLGFIGAFFNTFMLGGMGGDVVKLAYVLRVTTQRAAAVASIMLDRVIGLLGLVTLGGIALCWSWDEVVATPSLHHLSLAVFGSLGAFGLGTLISFIALAKGRRVAFLVWGILAAGIAIFSLLTLHRVPVIFTATGSDLSSSAALLRGRAILVIALDFTIAFLCILLVPSCQPGRRLERFIRCHVPLGSSIMHFIQAVLIFRDRFAATIASYGLSVFLQILVLISFFLLSQALALTTPPSLNHVFFAAPPAMVANALPVPGGGLGVGEAAFDQILNLCRTEEGEPVRGGAAIFLFYRFWSILLNLIGLFFYLQERKEIEEAEAEYRASEEFSEEEG